MKNSTMLDSLSKVPKIFIGVYLILLLLVAIYIRVHGTGEYYYSQDEAMHVEVSKGKDLIEVVKFSLYEAHPPLLYTLLHYWLMVFNNPAFVRGFSLLFGLGTILFYYAIGKKLNGEFTGIVAATLAAFSFGLIIQSYVVRQYSLLVFLLSVCFYCYLYWHDTRSRISLSGYALFGLLACLAHFSAVFAIFIIAATETLHLIIKRARWQQQLSWIIINLFLAMVTAIALYMQHSLLSDFRQLYATPAHTEPLFFTLAYALISFIPLVAYISPYPEFLLLWITLWLAAAGYLFYTSRNLFTLMMIVLAVEILSKASYLYPFDANFIRHDIWTAPFIIIPVAWLLADISSVCVKTISTHYICLYIIAGAFFITGLLMYNPELRFSEASEYMLKENEWKAVTQYLNSLDNTHLIITSRSDAPLLSPPDANPYKVMETNTKETLATGIIPLKHAKMLFPEFYFHYDGDTLIHMMKDAQSNGTLDGVDTLVFARIKPSQTSTFLLLYCDALDKKLIFIPPLNTAPPATKEEIHDNPIVLLEIPKDVFFKQVVAQNGKAHACLQDKENHANP